MKVSHVCRWCGKIFNAEHWEDGHYCSMSCNAKAICDRRRWHNDEELAAVLLRRRELISESGCWLWTGGGNDRGYGTLTNNGRHYYTHRLAAYLWLGMDIDSPLEVCHRCDVPRCFNPKHLFVATHAENMRDMHMKGRAPSTKGENAGRAKLSEEQVREIRVLSKQGVGYRRLSKQFGIDRATARSIVLHRTWKHID